VARQSLFVNRKVIRGKGTPPAPDKSVARAVFGKTLLLLFLGSFERGLGGLRFGGALLELVHASGGIHEFLLTGVKRMAHVTNTDDNGRLGGAGLDHVATGATDFRVHIFWMNVRLHKKGGNPTMKTRDDKGEFLAGDF
jgi:hypothetical protein